MKVTWCSRPNLQRLKRSTSWSVMRVVWFAWTHTRESGRAWTAADVALNGTRLQTAFTVSVEAREGITTGISAYDRARTIAVAIDPDSRPSDIVSPGHVFPLMARDGGTLMRAGHTEGAVDIARLAGLDPSGVICEIMNDDGTMARLPDLVMLPNCTNLRLGLSRISSRTGAVLSGWLNACMRTAYRMSRVAIGMSSFMPIPSNIQSMSRSPREMCPGTEPVGPSACRRSVE